ncbi:MAG: hypothetical protein J5654_06130 [Victivallales bacterium]|nr:hypothetical protein [Victivallales bacterium]
MNVQIPITILSDEKGYFDRECPNPDCLYTFKIKMQDWQEKVSDEEVHCPMCGHVDTSDKWWTQEQITAQEKIAEEWALNYARQMLNNTFKKIADSTRHNKYVKFTYKPYRTINFRNNPIGQREEWETEITCEQCGTQYSVIGSAYFCPCCGFNSANQVFFDTMERIAIMLDTLPGMRAYLEELNNRDDADSICRGLLESTIGDIVSAFQKYAARRYEILSGTDNVRVNDFQIIDKGSQMFRELCGDGYDKWLTSDELVYLKMLFQRRHILEHNSGIVDQRYIDQSGDASYNVGQRIVVHERDARRLLAIVQKLGEGLKLLEKH